jgi:hypothetical protein
VLVGCLYICRMSKVEKMLKVESRRSIASWMSIDGLYISVVCAVKAKRISERKATRELIKFIIDKFDDVPTTNLQRAYQRNDQLTDEITKKIRKVYLHRNRYFSISKDIRIMTTANSTATNEVSAAVTTEQGAAAIASNKAVRKEFKCPICAEYIPVVGVGKQCCVCNKLVCMECGNKRLVATEVMEITTWVGNDVEPTKVWIPEGTMYDALHQGCPTCRSRLVPATKMFFYNAVAASVLFKCRAKCG